MQSTNWTDSPAVHQLFLQCDRVEVLTACTKQTLGCMQQGSRASWPAQMLQGAEHHFCCGLSKLLIVCKLRLVRQNCTIKKILSNVLYVKIFFYKGWPLAFVHLAWPPFGSNTRYLLPSHCATPECSVQPVPFSVMR